MKNIIKKIVEIIAGFLTRRIIKKNDPLIIGITGSVGKTSSKDAIYTVIKSKYRCGKSWGNLNSELGLPLAVAGFREAEVTAGFWLKALRKMFRLAFGKNGKIADILVLEMGADKPGDIKKLIKLAPPRIGVITNIGVSHLENFKRINGTISEKRKLIENLEADDCAILCGDDKRVLAMAKKTKAQIITYGINSENLVKAVNVTFHYGWKGLGGNLDWGVSFKLNYEDNVVPIRLNNILGIQQIYAALAAASCGICLDMNLLEISEALLRYTPPKGRLNVIAGFSGSVILDDTYNSAPASALAALEVLGKANAKRKIAVLADMLELGSQERTGHEKVGKYAGEVADVILTFGERGRIIAREAAIVSKGTPKIIEHFNSQDELIDYLGGFLKEGVIVLVKGSQRMRMEKVVEAIMQNPEDAKKLLVRQNGQQNREPKTNN